MPLILQCKFCLSSGKKGGRRIWVFRGGSIHLTQMTPVHLLHIKLIKKTFLFSLAYFWTPAVRTDVGDTCLACCTSWWPWASLYYSGLPALLVSSAQWLFQQTHMPRQILVRRKAPKLFLTISKRGDVSQVLSADLRNILHHEDLPGQFIQEVSCHKWCFTGEHDLLVKTNRSHWTKKEPSFKKKKKNLQNTWSEMTNSLLWTTGSP